MYVFHLLTVQYKDLLLILELNSINSGPNCIPEGQIMATMVLPTSTRIQYMLYTSLKVFVHTETFMYTNCLILTHFTRSCNEGKYNLGTQQHKKITFGKLNNYIASFYKHAKKLGAKTVDIYFRGNISISIKLFGIIIGLASNSCQLIIVHSVQRAI